MTHTSSFIRTDKAIMQAFIELLKEKSFEKITVQDILDRTPVTRATFYAHYHDKYEIAERMLEQFLQLRENVRKELQSHTELSMVQVVKKHFLSNKEFLQALLKIHTDTVDLRKTICDEFEAFYLHTEKGPVSHIKQIEARIYAQARTEMELSQIMDDTNIISFGNSNEIYLNASLKLLRLDKDKETRQFLKKKLAEKKPES